MMSCKQSSLLMSSGEVDRAPLRVRWAMWVHLFVCKSCRAFRVQLALLTDAARDVSHAAQDEPRADLVDRIVEKHRL